MNIKFEKTRKSKMYHFSITLHERYKQVNKSRLSGMSLNNTSLFSTNANIVVSNYQQSELSDSQVDIDKMLIFATDSNELAQKWVKTIRDCI